MSENNVEPEIELSPPRHYREYLTQRSVDGGWVFIGEWCYDDTVLRAVERGLSEIKKSRTSIRCYGEPGCYLLFWKPPVEVS